MFCEIVIILNTVPFVDDGTRRIGASLIDDTLEVQRDSSSDDVRDGDDPVDIFR